MVKFAEYMKYVIEKQRPGHSADFCVQTSALTHNTIKRLLEAFPRCFSTGVTRKKENLKAALVQNIVCNVNPEYIG